MTLAEETQEEQCKELFETYIDHAAAFCNKTKIHWPDGTWTTPDESLMRLVENAIDVPEQAAADFRLQVCAWVLNAIRRGDEPTWRGYDPLYMAIGKVVGGYSSPPPIPEGCTCDIMILMTKGCVCGHLKNGKS